eukprot:TRINITY_DN6967_c0_g2_i1.p1 TRINITY_DN6967_c0_g2~~TRINITY_DN6967_c0_g2_i1.p1  ORF type:complete len:465 (-),score=112.24 TRINITY_DN6967_c0_g2_i1:6-1400(-)
MADNDNNNEDNKPPSSPNQVYRVDSGDLTIAEKLSSLEHIYTDEEVQHLDNDNDDDDDEDLVVRHCVKEDDEAVQLSFESGDDVEVDDEEPDVLHLDAAQLKRRSQVSSDILKFLPESAKGVRRRSRMVDPNLLNLINAPTPSTMNASSGSRASVDSKLSIESAILEGSNEYGCPPIHELEVLNAGKKLGEEYLKESPDFVSKPEKRKSAFVKLPDLGGAEEYDLNNIVTPELSIPSIVFIEDAAGKSRLAFCIKIVSSFGCINRPRRMSEIRVFDKECRTLFPDLDLEKLPQKLTFGLNRNRKISERRRVQLEHYLRMGCQLSNLRPHLSEFLSVEPSALFEVGDHYKKHPPENMLDSSQDFLPFTSSTKSIGSNKARKTKSTSLFSRKPTPISVDTTVSSPTGPSPVFTKRTTPSAQEKVKRKSNILPQAVAENVHKSMLVPKQVTVPSPAGHEKQHRRTSA